MTEARSAWFAIQVRGRSEASVHLHLLNRGLYSFLPAYTVRRRGFDRIRQSERPLFPGYLFCRIDSAKWLPILTTPGVLRIVGNGRQPVHVDEAEITAIQRVVASGLPVRPWPSVEVGSQVRIIDGALAGLEGSITRVKGQHRLIVSVTLLQRSVSVELDDCSIEMIPFVRRGAGSLLR